MVALLAGVLLSGPLTAGLLNTPNNYLGLTGSADWEFYRSDSELNDTSATFDVFRQRYGVTLAGSIWNRKFNQFSLGVDFFRADRRVDGNDFDSSTIGYRAVTTFFPERTFPLRLYARRSSTGVAGVALADSDRETAAWGAEWNLTRRQQNLRLSYEKAAFDLLSPVALRERRMSGLAEFTQRYGNSEAVFRYELQDQDEMVNGTELRRQTFTVRDRTRFSNDLTLIVNGSHTMSDATFVTRKEDNLTTTRINSLLDWPRRDRFSFGISYDFNNNDGRSVEATSHDLRGRTRVSLGEHWETTAGVSLGQIETVLDGVAPTSIDQDTVGANAGVVFRRQFGRVSLSTGYSLGLLESDFSSGADRNLVNQSAHVDARIGVTANTQLFSTLTRREDESDTTGLGFEFDETRAELGVEGTPGTGLHAQASTFYRDSVNDTFQFGVQESNEFGLEGMLTHPDGSMTLTLSTREGISEFFPDPSATPPPFLGNELVSQADTAMFALRWRLPHRIQIHAQARYEDREFTTIGKERIRYYHPRIEWNPRVWSFSLGYSYYERSNTTNYSDGTWQLKISRRFF
jgi:hypothetical protein